MATVLTSKNKWYCYVLIRYKSNFYPAKFVLYYRSQSTLYLSDVHLKPYYFIVEICIITKPIFKHKL